jgi:hypothetical protein
MRKYLLALVAVAALGLTACGSVAQAADLAPEGQALAAVGFQEADIATPSPSSKANPKPKRKWLRRNTLHGEVVVQTKDGTRTVLVQRGDVTAINDTTMTVKSTDGFSQTWTFGDKLRVVERRATIQPEDVKVGDEVGVAGTKNGDQSLANLVVIPVSR